MTAFNPFMPANYAPAPAAAAHAFVSHAPQANPRPFLSFYYAAARDSGASWSARGWSASQLGALRYAVPKIIAGHFRRLRDLR